MTQPDATCLAVASRQTGVLAPVSMAACSCVSERDPSNKEDGHALGRLWYQYEGIEDNDDVIAAQQTQCYMSAVGKVLIPREADQTTLSTSWHDNKAHTENCKEIVVESRVYRGRASGMLLLSILPASPNAPDFIHACAERDDHTVSKLTEMHRAEEHSHALLLDERLSIDLRRSRDDILLMRADRSARAASCICTACARSKH